ncbi:MAG: hypothetical protein ABI378_03860 [Chitinophagaceae bacterium]
MVRKILLLVLSIGCTIVTYAQCLSGDCNNGKGKYDFGWCQFEGEFKDSKADGTGIMTYNDYTYTGHFSKGVEDGEGTITYANGRQESVRYHDGRKLAGITKVAAGEYKPLIVQDSSCISGDCVNGIGTYKYPSGKYSGRFKDRKRDGSGTFNFNNGDSFSGIWKGNDMSNGTYSFASGASYSGSYDGSGREQNGTMKVDGMTIPFVNGMARVPQQPKPNAAYQNNSRQSASSKPAYKPCCPFCHCLGQTHETFTGGATAVDRYGNRSTVFGAYTKCSRCNGTGHIDQ